MVIFGAIDGFSRKVKVLFRFMLWDVEYLNTDIVPMIPNVSSQLISPRWTSVKIENMSFFISSN